MSRCRSCQAPILWALTEKGRRMPLDQEPYTGPEPAGLFVLRAGVGAGPPKAIAVTPDAFPGEPVYRSHFSTCPNAKEHRRR